MYFDDTEFFDFFCDAEMSDKLYISKAKKRIRQCNEEIEDSQRRIDKILSDERSAKARNVASWGLVIIFLAVCLLLFITGHWFIAIFTFLGLWWVVELVIECLDVTASSMHTSNYHSELQNERRLISHLKAEINDIEVKIEEVKKRANRRNANENQRDYQQRSDSHGTYACNEITLKEQYDILGCSPEVSNSKLKKVYMELMRAYHPDHVRSVSGNDEHLVKLAEEQTKKVNNAYDVILRARGLR